jgi:hypothetical protein
MRRQMAWNSWCEAEVKFEWKCGLDEEWTRNGIRKSAPVGLGMEIPGRIAIRKVLGVRDVQSNERALHFG